MRSSFLYRLRTRAFRLLVLALPLLGTGTAAQEISPRWSISKLNGVVSYHDGPNCLNGALAAQGYTDDLVHATTGEFFFYVFNFCERRPPEQRSAGDLLVVGPGEHAAIQMDGDLVFEKRSFDGFYGYWNHERSAAETGYFIEPKSATRYFGHEMAFHCAPAEGVRNALKACAGRESTRRIQLVRSFLTDLTLNKSKTIYTAPAEPMMSALADVFPTEARADVCDLFDLVTGLSLTAQFQYMKWEDFRSSSYELPELEKSIERLRTKFASLSRSLRERNALPKMEFVLDEADRLIGK